MSVARVLIMCAALPACDVIFRVDPIAVDAPGTSASDSTTTDAACTTVGKYGAGDTGLFAYRVCDPMPVTLPSTIRAPGNCTIVDDPAAGSVCVIAGSSITATDPVVYLGAIPLVLVATETIVIESSIELTQDVTSAVTTACTPAAAPALNAGAAGGSYGSSGADGGAGSNMGATGGVAGTARVGSLTLRGGCPGASAIQPAGGFGGTAGGAVYLAAGTRISLANATIDASGGGGKGGGIGFTAGGGGGGAGGLIAFDTPLLDIDASSQIFANGGGGGGGGAKAGSMTGVDGAASTGTIEPGLGAAATGGGAGGNGATRAADAVSGGLATTGGGGGGGGGLGVIALYLPTSVPIANASPTPELTPL